MSTTNPTTTSTTGRPARSPYLLVAAVVLLAAGVLGGYLVGRHQGSSQTATSVTGETSRASTTGHNEADLAFAQMMVPHHAQALIMARMADRRSSSAQVKALAHGIERAQRPEIARLDGWLKTWGANTGMDHGPTAMGSGDGMMSRGDLLQLSKLSGAAFDHRFLTMMIAHHSGALRMAEEELENGENSAALSMATSIRVTQQAQITAMRGLLG